MKKLKISLAAQILIGLVLGASWLDSVLRTESALSKGQGGEWGGVEERLRDGGTSRA